VPRSLPGQSWQDRHNIFIFLNFIILHFLLLLYSHTHTHTHTHKCIITHLKKLYILYFKNCNYSRAFPLRSHPLRYLSRALVVSLAILSFSLARIVLRYYRSLFRTRCSRDIIVLSRTRCSRAIILSLFHTRCLSKACSCLYCL